MVVGGAGCSPAWAAAPEQPAEDDAGSDAEDEAEGYERLVEEVVGATVVYPQDQGEIQLTLEPSYLRRRADHLGIVTYDVEIGATDWLQLELAWTAPVIRGVGGGGPTAVGHGGLELGTQLTWMHMRGSPFSAALAFEANVPVGRRLIALESDEAGAVYEPFITFAVDPPSGRAQVFTNVGMELSAEERRPFLNAGVIGAAALTRPYVVVSCSPTEAYVVPGMSFVLPAGWEIIAGVSVGMSRRSVPIGAGFLVVYEFNPLERRRQ